jgi:hypothetical protein
VALDRVEALRRVEHVEEEGRDAAVEGGAEQLGGAADVRRRQVHEEPVAGAEVEADGEPHVLHEDALVAEQGRLGRAGGAGGEDDEAAVAPPDPAAGAAQPPGELREDVGAGDAADVVLHPGRAREEALALLLELDPPLDARHGAHHLAQHGEEHRRAHVEVAAGPDLLERGAQLARLEAQVERRHDHAEAVAREQQEHVLLEQGEAGREDVPLPEPVGEEPRGERIGGPVEGAPGDRLAGVVLDEREAVRIAPRVLGHPVGDVLRQRRAAAEALLVELLGLHGHSSRGRGILGEEGPPGDAPRGRGRGRRLSARPAAPRRSSRARCR